MPFDAHQSTAARSLDTLALRARAGVPGADKALVEALLERLRPLVTWRIFASKRWALSEQDIEDALHDLILLVWQQDLAVFDPERSGFLTFVSRRIDWHLCDRARRARRDAGDEADDEEIEEVIDEDRDPDSLLSRAALEKDLLVMSNFVDGFAGDDTARTVIERHDLEGATLSEVAKELDIHVSNACRARQRGLKRLQRAAYALAA